MGEEDLADVQPGPATRRTQQQIAAELGEIGYALPGTITRRMMRCGKTGCACQDDPDRRHGPYIQWTRTVDGQTVTKMLSEQQLARYQTWFDNHRRARELLDELNAVSLDAIHEAEGWS